MPWVGLADEPVAVRERRSRCAERVVTTATAALDVLLIEDDPGDVLMVREVFEEHGWAGRLAIVGDGLAAIDYIRRSGQYAGVTRPDVVLLDLNLPGMGGREVLHFIKSDPELGRIPVVVLTTSAAEEDIIRCYASHANAYVTKPIDWSAFTGAIRGIGHFFADVARLPARTTSDQGSGPQTAYLD